MVLPSPLFISSAYAANRDFIYKISVRFTRKKLTLTMSLHLMFNTFRPTEGYFLNVSENIVTLLINDNFTTVGYVALS